MSTVSADEAVWFAEVFDKLIENMERAVIGRTEVVKIAATCLFAQGHLLLEDIAGSGKTTLARAIARSVYGTQARIQFTPDLSPSDITGTAVFDERTDRYRFHPGPLFNSLVVADEINRASPRTQSALLEVMEEARVTVRGITNTIGPPFMVIATQNPNENAEGTFQLPEAQLDRFLMRLHMGHPSAESTFQLLADSAIRDRSTLVEPIVHPPTLARACAIANTIWVDPGIIRYVTEIVEETRIAPGVKNGASIRGALAFVRSAKAWAASHGRAYVVPSDVQDLAHPVLDHRVTLHPDAMASGLTSETIVDQVMNKVSEPTR